MPTRTCIGCRKTDEKNLMIRIVDQDGIAVDRGQTAPGRGAYVHPRTSCVERGLDPRRLARSFRCEPARFDGPALGESKQRLIELYGERR